MAEAWPSLSVETPGRQGARDLRRALPLSLSSSGGRWKTADCTAATVHSDLETADCGSNHGPDGGRTWPLAQQSLELAGWSPRTQTAPTVRSHAGISAQSRSDRALSSVQRTELGSLESTLRRNSMCQRGRGQGWRTPFRGGGDHLQSPALHSQDCPVSGSGRPPR